jgi:WhiB family transcriptional regulator, redox-sensing transcriptional regulator
MTTSVNDWQHKAACTSHDPELFFPIGSASPALAQLERARQICRSCPVQTRCLEWAISTGADDGIWGGLNEEERRSLRRRQRSRRNRTTDQRTPLPPDVLAAQTASRQRTANVIAALPPPGHRVDISRSTP